MLKKKLKWAIVPVVAVIAFAAFSSFTDESENAPKCKIVGESYDASYTQVVNSDCSSTCTTGGTKKCYMYSK
jgi:hypothetical protein